MQALRYPPKTLVGDYLRATAGVGVGLGVLVANPAGWTLGLVFGGVAGVFGLFGWRTAERHMTRIGVNEQELVKASLGTKCIPWDQVGRVKLRYYGTKRQQRHEGGFFQLTLWGDGTKLVFESNLEGFDFLVWRSAEAARSNQVPVDPSTAGNMLALGIDPDGEQAPPDGVLQTARKVAQTEGAGGHNGADGPADAQRSA